MTRALLSATRDALVLRHESSAILLERLQTDDALLTYGATTDPSPVQASASPTNLSVATLTIVVSCPTNVGSATVRQLLVTIPCDIPPAAPDPTNLAAVAPTKASISSSGKEEWVVSDGDVPGSFVFAPKLGPVAVADQGLAITIPNIQMSTLVGTAVIEVSEWAAQDGDAPAPDTDPASGRATMKLSKFPPGFTISKFEATTPAVGPDYYTTISWAGSDRATYTLQYDDTVVPDPRDPSAKPLPPQGSLQVADLQYDPTIFTLVVKAQVGGATLVARRQAAVTVRRARGKFLALPTNLAKGATCHLSWRTNGDRVMLEDQPFDGPNGSTDVVVMESRSFNVTVYKDDDVFQDSRNVRVMPQSITSFTATVKGVLVTGPVEAGTEVTLAWTTRYASTVSITPEAAPPFPVQGKVTVKPMNSTTYTLSASGLLPDVKQTLSIAIIPVSISSFTAQPSSIDPGNQFVTFGWVTSRATSLQIVYDGDLVLHGNTKLLNPNPAGSIRLGVRALSDATFTLTCNGPDGPVSRPVVLHVNNARITRFDIVSVEWNLVLTWSTEFATIVRLTVDKGGVIPDFAAGTPRIVDASGQVTLQLGPALPPFHFDLFAFTPRFEAPPAHATADWPPEAP